MNDMRRNDYLRRREDRRRDMMMRRDSRNPYGSRGGYVDSRNPYGRRGGYRDHNMGRDMAMDSRDYAPEHNRGGASPHDFGPHGPGYGVSYERPREHSRPAEFEIYGVGGMRPRNDYGMSGDYRNDYRGDYRNDYNSGNDYYDGNYDYRGDYSSQGMEQEYKKKLHEWIEKLSKKNRFPVSMDQVIQQAKNMGVKFEEFDEEEFYAIYLMVISDYPTISNEYNMYIRMAKDWIMDDDVAVSPSEKVCKYLYTIVLGED